MRYLFIFMSFLGSFNFLSHNLIALPDEDVSLKPYEKWDYIDCLKKVENNSDHRRCSPLKKHFCKKDCNNANCQKDRNLAVTCLMVCSEFNLPYECLKKQQYQKDEDLDLMNKNKKSRKNKAHKRKFY